MEEKVFDFLEKLYIEMQDMKANMATKQDLQEMQNEMQVMKSNMATKKDLEGMATKKDLEGMATKKDLEGMATKKDLEGMATKKDLEGMATKKDLEGLATKQDLARMENEIKDDIKVLYDGYAQSLEGINEIRTKIDLLTDKVENQEIRLQVLRSAK